MSGAIVKQPLCSVVAWLSIFTLLTGTEMAEAGPFRDFFRPLSGSTSRPNYKPRSHQSSRTHKKAPPSDALIGETSGSPVAAPPGRRNIRMAKATPGTNGQKGDLPYGTPVPGKPRLVTSPFAPDSGYVDVRGFSPGTAVEDPYSGKIFLTP